MRRLLTRFKFDMTRGRGFYLAVLANLVGTSAAGVVNCLSMRWSELKGVQVMDKHHQPLGQSKLAGRQVLGSMCVSRATLAGLAIGLNLTLGILMGRFRL
mmetsp:Transcript_31609/g.68944  ORF Transcript_31609/g.68944 Transcript_31609/m.68944 type:complete len:100 (-) Transcript_31609:483-782(-)